MAHASKNDWGHVTRENLERAARPDRFDGLGYLLWMKMDPSCLGRGDLGTLLEADLGHVGSLSDGCIPHVRAAQRQVHEAIEVLSRRGIKRITVGVSWCDWKCWPGGKAWIAWYLRQFAPHFDIVPRITFTPPPETEGGTINARPRRLVAYAEFMHEFLSTFGDIVGGYTEHWNEWNLATDWRRDLDEQFEAFMAMIAASAIVARHHGKKVLLGGMAGITHENLTSLADMARGGLSCFVDAVGYHDLRGTWGDQEPSAPISQQTQYARDAFRAPPLGAYALIKGLWACADEASPAVRKILRKELARRWGPRLLAWARPAAWRVKAWFGLLKPETPKPVWLTEYGFPAIDPEGRFAQEYLEDIQVALFAYAAYSVATGDVGRVYWYTLRDYVGESVRAHTTGWEDVLQYYYGDLCVEGRCRLLGRLLDEGGVERVLDYAFEHDLFRLIDAASLGRTKPDAYKSNDQAKTKVT